MSKRKDPIIELTYEQLMTAELEYIGFDGQVWSHDVDAVIVNSIAVFDRSNAISTKGAKMMNRWLLERFGYKL